MDPGPRGAEPQKLKNHLYTVQTRGCFTLASPFFRLPLPDVLFFWFRETKKVLALFLIYIHIYIYMYCWFLFLGGDTKRNIRCALWRFQKGPRRQERLGWGPLQAGRFASGHALAVFSGSLLAGRRGVLFGSRNPAKKSWVFLLVSL